jgi:hypothetical protein
LIPSSPIILALLHLFVLLRSSASTPILQCRNRLSSSCAISVDGRYTFQCVSVRQSKVRQWLEDIFLFLRVRQRSRWLWECVYRGHSWWKKTCFCATVPLVLDSPLCSLGATCRRHVVVLWAACKQVQKEWELKFLAPCTACRWLV